MQMDSNFTSIAEFVRRDVEGILLRVGLLCRVFGRGKSRQSLEFKHSKESSKYTINGRLIQDAIGIRVALYFSEDIEIVQKLLTSRFNLDERSSTIDMPSSDQFTVVRYNLIFRIPDDYLSDMQREIGQMPIDTTFELQLRSILSEGWHEVDHDLRYKSKENWIGQDDLSRALNGIMATLEISEWSMRRIFDDLAYRHYKNGNWAAMLHSKVRMRALPHLSQHLIELMNRDVVLAKENLQINRKHVIHSIAHSPFKIPITLDNIVYIWNCIGAKNRQVLDVTPKLILQALNETTT